MLEEVAALYREYFDDGPWQVIADRFGVSEVTAGRYVGKARKAGLLPPTTPGKKKV
jgi:DNA-binding transcriptional regulator LsrR (DeoR family)